MPSNKELIVDIEAEANAKGVDIPVTEGLNNAQLADTLKTLKAAAPAPAPKTDDETDDKTDDETDDEVEAVKRPPYYICDNKSITSMGGTLSEGMEVKAKHVGGMERIKELIKAGIVAKG